MLVGGCGHIGFDAREGQGDPDAVPGCPPDMVPIETGADVCIEKSERGNDTWTTARSTCLGLGRRLCEATEWYTGCVSAPVLADMADDPGGAEWEWFAGEEGGVAEKGGFAACTDTSSHAVVDPYDYRCCLTLGG